MSVPAILGATLIEVKDFTMGNDGFGSSVFGSNNFNDSWLCIFETSAEDSYERKNPSVCILLLDSWNNNNSFILLFNRQDITGSKNR